MHFGGFNAQRQKANLNARLHFKQGIIHREYIMHPLLYFQGFLRVAAA
jgi:hypothetical protein